MMTLLMVANAVPTGAFAMSSFDNGSPFPTPAQVWDSRRPGIVKDRTSKSFMQGNNTKTERNENKATSDNKVRRDGNVVVHQRPARAPMVSSLIERKPGVSNDFIQTVEAALRNVSPQIKTALARSGYKITASRTISDAVPEAKDQQVRGYQPHTTWNSVYGMFNRSTKRVIMAELAEIKDRSGASKLGPLYDNNLRNGILKHELGHAIDQYLNHYSHSEDFVRAYQKGLTRIPEAHKDELSYYLQEGPAGREETFAELFALICDGSCDPRTDALLKRYFPEVVQLVTKQLHSFDS